MVLITDLPVALTGNPLSVIHVTFSTRFFVTRIEILDSAPHDVTPSLIKTEMRNLKSAPELAA